MVMNLGRILRHLLTPDWRVRAHFPARTMRAIEVAIADTERAHAGQIRFAVETTLEFAPLLRGVSARERALEVFAQLRVWDTEANNGVLIYLLLADHDVEIVADRGIHAKVGAAEWERICHAMEKHFRAGRFEQGVLEGIRAVGAQLARHYPGAARGNELPDAPIIV
jgi:uncharacterized membrane protein